MQEDYRDSIEIQNISDDGLDVEYLPDLLEGVKRYGVILPAKDIQFPVIKYYLSAPSHRCSVLGVLFSQGMSGSGKSELTKIGQAIHGLSPSEGIVMAESSPTSIRNKIMNLKYGSSFQEHVDAGGSLEEIEQNCILLWDDIKPSHLKNQFMLSLLKSGYSRKSAIVEIAVPGEGKNQSFNVFSKKVTSSIHPIWQNPELIELKRRIFPIRHVPYGAMSPQDKSDNLSPDDERLVIWDYVDFSGYKGFDDFWSTDRLDAFSRLSKDRKIRNVIRKSGIPTAQSQLSQDIMITGMILDDLSVGNIVDIFSEYWRYVTDEMLSKKSSLEIFLNNFICASLAQWEESGIHGVTHEIAPQELTVAIQKAVVRGEILESHWRSLTGELLLSAGYEQLPSDINSRVCWKRTF